MWYLSLFVSSLFHFGVIIQSVALEIREGYTRAVRHKTKTEDQYFVKGIRVPKHIQKRNNNKSFVIRIFHAICSMIYTKSVWLSEHDIKETTFKFKLANILLDFVMKITHMLQCDVGKLVLQTVLWNITQVTYNVHESEEVRFNTGLSMVTHHHLISDHQCFYVPLSA